MAVGCLGNSSAAGSARAADDNIVGCRANLRENGNCIATVCMDVGGTIDISQSKQSNLEEDFYFSNRQ